MLRTMTLTVAAIIVSAAFAIAVATLPAADAETPPQIVSLRAAEGELSGTTTTTAAPTTTTTTPPTTTTAAPTTTTTAAPAPPPPVMQPAGSCSGWLDLVTANFPADAVSTACRIIACESGGNPQAENRTSSASGIAQFLSGTWITTTGLAPPASAYAPAIQIQAMATLWSRSGFAPWSCY